MTDANCDIPTQCQYEYGSHMRMVMSLKTKRKHDSSIGQGFLSDGAKYTIKQQSQTLE